MWAAIFRFEIRYQLRQPIFYLVTCILGALLFIAATDGGATGRLHLNAPAVIIEQMLKGIPLVLFLMTAFVASAALRDFDRRTSELFFSRPLSRVDYLTARFAGTMVVCAIPYLVGTLALAAGSLMPDLDPARLSPFRFAPYAFALGVMILPTLFALGAAFYALATWTRSTLATYVGVVLFFAANAAAGVAASQLEWRWLAQLLDPFGVTALSGAVAYWTVAELNVTTPDLGGMLLLNRVFWLALGLSALALAVGRFDPSRPALRLRRRAGQRPDADESSPSPRPTMRLRPRTPARVFSRYTVFLQFAGQVRHEAGKVLRSLPFLAMLALGLLLLIQSAASTGNLFGMPVHPRTPLMLDALRDSYSIVLLLVVVLYSGELIWKDRALEMDAILDSMPIPNGMLVGAKLAALVLVIAVFLLTGALTLIGFQLSQGYHHLEIGRYAQGLALAAIHPMLMGVLACFCHALARSRLMGYGLVILFIVSWDVLEEFGFEHHLMRFASLPATPWSDFNGYGPFLAPFAWYGLYWGCGALVLVGLSIMLWTRGTDDAWRPRRAEAVWRFHGPVRAMILIGCTGMLATGGWIFFNTNVLNHYLPSPAAAEHRARYEQRYATYRHLAQPRIIAVQADVDIFPERRRIDIRGTYRLRNRSGEPLHELHVSVPERVRVQRLDLPEHQVVLEDEDLGYRIHRLRKPLAPGDVIELRFTLSVDNPGFLNHGTDTAVVGNGTYFTKRDVFPVIGYDAQRQLVDPEARQRQGLEPTPRLAGIDDSAARRNSPRAPDADRIQFESTVSTEADQIAVTSGELQREWLENGRRYFHYRAQTPITHHFAYASARYAVTRRSWQPTSGADPGVAIEVYHHPDHAANVPRMIDAASRSLAYYSDNFGRYPHQHLRIVEFPRYVRDATAFPGLIAWSEALGFNARLDGEQAIDYPFYVTAHEVAHQWWGQQLVGADVQGVGMLHETLAQYSALMVMEDEFGKEGVRRVLAQEHDWYLRGRAGERGVETPLARVDRQDYVYYHKGALAMHALRDAVGEAPLNQALSRLLARVAPTQPPYSSTAELLEALRPLVPEDSGQLANDLFERIVRFDNRIADATYEERGDGSFRVRVELELRKLRTDTEGEEADVPVDDWIDIALSVAAGGQSENHELTLAAHRIQGSRATIETTIDQRPTRVTIDPYYKLIDRDRSDNVRDLAPAGAATRR